MPFLRRNEISWNERYRRCLYFFLRDELDSILLTESLVESYKAFKGSKKEYPFVEMRELKPRAKIHGPEYAEQRPFIVIFSEEVIPSETKTHIRFFDSNKITKENLGLLALFDLKDVFYQRMRYFDSSGFVTLLKSLLTTDYALLIQRDPSIRARYRFGLSHFHVKIDWPVATAAEDLGRYLKYISKDLYEKGDRIGEILQQKLYEYYALHYTVGGRRTAGLVAAQYLARFDFISTVYVSSSESRTLLRTSESGVSRYALIRISNHEIKDLSRKAKLTQKEFIDAYLIDKMEDYGVGIFLVTYGRNEHSLPPEDGKPRELNPDYQWLNVDLQMLVPPPYSGAVRPIHLSRVYA
ncbi:MAG TPA: hypothetical protein VMC85_15325 [Desulfomonilaceae bacterium]|nr:hypothetical protein [Desulfomonilaceae bacterium]